MARRIKRRPRVVWLPPAPFFRLGFPGGGTPASNVFSKGIGSSGNAPLGFPGTLFGSTTAVFPVVSDSGTTTIDVQGSLSDFANSAYRLRRVVGKIFVGVDQTVNDADAAIQGLVTAGLIVLRTRTGLDNNEPLDAPFDYDTQAIANWSDPWIWRRTWMLGNNSANLEHPNLHVPFYPEVNTTGYGSALDGPHVDAKTARIVGPEERLFLVVSCVTTESQAQVETLTPVRVYWDLRCVASMRTSMGNRGNSNR